MEKFIRNEVETKQLAIKIMNSLGLTDIKLSDLTLRDAKKLIKEYNKLKSK